MNYEKLGGMEMISALLKRPLWQKIAAAFVVGIVAGSIGGPGTVHWAKPIGDLYLNLMRLIVVPLVFVSVSASIVRLRETSRPVQLLARTLLWFAITAACAIVVGMAAALLLKPGVGLGNIAAESVKPQEIPSMLSVFVNIIPSNPFRALADGNVLQVLFLGVLFGASLYVVGENARFVRQLLEQGEKLIYVATKWILQLTPLGTFGLIAWVVGQYGLSSLMPLGKFIGVIYAACLVHIILIYGGLLKLHGLSVGQFFRNIFAAQQMAFASSSSMATLPLSLRTSVDKLGVRESYASFALPLGATIKMDGCGALYPSIAAIFIAQYFSVDLSSTQYLLIGCTALLGSFATAGVPGTSLVMLTLTLSAAGLPLEGIGYIIAIDRIIDMMRTATNVTGQLLVAVVVADEEGLLDKNIYNGQRDPAIADEQKA